jgi:hypothetical protein
MGRLRWRKEDEYLVSLFLLVLETCNSTQRKQLEFILRNWFSATR